jgi:hypothetical protein
MNLVPIFRWMMVALITLFICLHIVIIFDMGLRAWDNHSARQPPAKCDTRLTNIPGGKL